MEQDPRGETARFAARIFLRRSEKFYFLGKSVIFTNSSIDSQNLLDKIAKSVYDMACNYL
jgi:hypothetical protein